jgi:hypothetical protein
VQPEAGELTLLADARIGQPDRRHRVAVTEHRKNLRVDLVGLACQRRETLDFLGVGDLDRPALLLEGVVDDPCAGSSTRSPRRPARSGLPRWGERAFSTSRRPAVRRAGPDALPDRRAGKRQASFDLDRVRRATCKRASSRLVLDDKRSLPPRRPSFMAVLFDSELGACRDGRNQAEAAAVAVGLHSGWWRGWTGGGR